MRGFRFLLRRALLAVVALTAASCGSLLGIDDGLPRDEGGALDGSKDSTTDRDALPESSSEDAPRSDAPDAGSALDADEGGRDAPAEDAADAADSADAGDERDSTASDGCVDTNWCTNHCGASVDNCGMRRPCTNNCPPSWVCDPTAICVCQSDPTWCIGRCGTMPDNCNAKVDCMTCEGGLACNGNTCGCTPQPNPCGSRLCGQTLDSCNHPVICGVNGMCAGGGVCDPNTGTCCTPLTNPCAGRCSTSVDNGCGQLIACPSGCPTGEVCDQTKCCAAPQCGNSCNTSLPNGCGTSVPCTCSGGQVCDPQGQCCTPTGGCSPTCVDNCGQPAPCCPEGGMCAPLGGYCSGGPQCCTGACAQGGSPGTCVTSCGGPGAPCLSSSDCCIPYNCSIVAPPLDAGMAQPLMGRCQ
jgi:hypothetical protein